jgi:hypothetical protein
MMYHWNLHKWDTVEIEREYEFGKRGIELAKVVGVFQQGKTRFALLDNGMKLYTLPPLSSDNTSND